MNPSFGNNPINQQGQLGRQMAAGQPMPTSPMSASYTPGMVIPPANPLPQRSPMSAMAPVAHPLVPPPTGPQPFSAVAQQAALGTLAQPQTTLPAQGQQHILSPIENEVNMIVSALTKHLGSTNKQREMGVR